MASNYDVKVYSVQAITLPDDRHEIIINMDLDGWAGTLTIPFGYYDIAKIASELEAKKEQ